MLRCLSWCGVRVRSWSRAKPPAALETRGWRPLSGSWSSRRGPSRGEKRSSPAESGGRRGGPNPGLKGATCHRAPSAFATRVHVRIHFECGLPRWRTVLGSESPGQRTVGPRLSCGLAAALGSCAGVWRIYSYPQRTHSMVSGRWSQGAGSYQFSRRGQLSRGIDQADAAVLPCAVWTLAAVSSPLQHS